MQKKELDMKKKNDQCKRNISDFFGRWIHWWKTDVTDSNSNDSTSDISNDAMQ